VLRAPNSENLKEASLKWLTLAVGALGLGGVFALLLVLARTPHVQEHIPFRDFFKVALAVHVNLTVLVWFLAFTIFTWVATAKGKVGLFARGGFGSITSGTVLLACSAFIADPVPLTSNYIPVLTGLTFASSIALIFAGTLIMCLWKIADFIAHSKNADFIELSAVVSAGITLISLITFSLSYISMPLHMQPDYTDAESLRRYYEILFWGGGHVLQFSHIQIMIMCWMILYGLKFHLPKYIGYLNLLLVLPAPFIYLVLESDNPDLYNAFTQHMRVAGGIIPILFFAAWLRYFSRQNWLKSPYLHYFFWSVIMFGAGGIIGFMIRGHNVTIPAHYHGSIVGVSIAMMGVALYVLPQMGRGQISLKHAAIQSFLYAFGQLMHITGLAISGGYGALRKSAETIMESGVKFGMGLMGAGGLLTMIGGLMFVIVFIKVLRKNG